MNKRGEVNMFRKSGLDMVGDVSWGTHLCQCYETKEDLRVCYSSLDKVLTDLVVTMQDENISMTI